MFLFLVFAFVALLLSCLVIVASGALIAIKFCCCHALLIVMFCYSHALLIIMFCCCTLLVLAPCYSCLALLALMPCYCCVLPTFVTCYYCVLLIHTLLLSPLVVLHLAILCLVASRLVTILSCLAPLYCPPCYLRLVACCFCFHILLLAILAFAPYCPTIVSCNSPFSSAS
jgi:hypothetical protein